MPVGRLINTRIAFQRARKGSSGELKFRFFLPWERSKPQAAAEDRATNVHESGGEPTRWNWSLAKTPTPTWLSISCYGSLSLFFVGGTPRYSAQQEAPSLWLARECAQRLGYMASHTRPVNTHGLQMCRWSIAAVLERRDNSEWPFCFKQQTRG
jgi:hypothetical protein